MDHQNHLAPSTRDLATGHLPASVPLVRQRQPRIAVVGGSLTGPVLALLLVRAGFNHVAVYEANPDLATASCLLGDALAPPRAHTARGAVNGIEQADGLAAALRQHLHHGADLTGVLLGWRRRHLATAVAAVRQGPAIGARLGLGTGSSRPKGAARDLNPVAGATPGH